jgi:lipoyl(octanoyl) transferase
VNCEPDLSYFGGIVACGLPGHGVTSLSSLAGRRVSVGEVRPLVRRHLADVFELAFVRDDPGARLAEPVAV